MNATVNLIPFHLRIKWRLDRYILKIFLISSLISASVTYSMAQYYSTDQLKEMYRKLGRRAKRSRSAELYPIDEDAE
jgi:hypothetical protein